MKTIVVGVTNVSTAEDAAHQAAELARELGARLHVVSAVSERRVFRVGSTTESWTFTSFDEAQQHLATMRVSLGDGFEFSSAVMDGDPADSLVAEAERLDADIIVIGSVGTQGIGRILGSVANEVIRKAPCAVYVAKTT